MTTPGSSLPSHYAGARRILAASAVLAACAGYVNVVLLSAEFTAVTHVTGAVSTLSADLSDRNLPEAAHVLSIIASFIFGAMISGFILGGESLRLGRPYGVSMLVQGMLLTLATALLVFDLPLGVQTAAVSAGLQNAMASSYGGLIIRTTHVTGVATDLGFLLGAWVRRRPVPLWKLASLLDILTGFLLGGVAGAFAASRFGVLSLLAPAMLVTSMGVAYYISRLRRRRKKNATAP